MNDLFEKDFNGFKIEEGDRNQRNFYGFLYPENFIDTALEIPKRGPPRVRRQYIFDFKNSS
jgi:hypothetical protein